VFVCAYRSILPRIDLERYCLFDTPWSNVVLGRSAATIAEVSVLEYLLQLFYIIFEYSDLPTSFLHYS